MFESQLPNDAVTVHGIDPVLPRETVELFVSGKGDSPVPEKNYSSFKLPRCMVIADDSVRHSQNKGVHHFLVFKEYTDERHFHRNRGAGTRAYDLIKLHVKRYNSSVLTDEERLEFSKKLKILTTEGEVIDVIQKAEEEAKAKLLAIPDFSHLIPITD